MFSIHIMTSEPALSSFINADKLSDHTLLWQTIIQVVFIVSALAIAWIDRLMGGRPD